MSTTFFSLWLEVFETGYLVLADFCTFWEKLTAHRQPVKFISIFLYLNLTYEQLTFFSATYKI